MAEAQSQIWVVEFPALARAVWFPSGQGRKRARSETSKIEGYISRACMLPVLFEIPETQRKPTSYRHYPYFNGVTITRVFITTPTLARLYSSHTIPAINGAGLLIAVIGAGRTVFAYSGKRALTTPQSNRVLGPVRSWRCGVFQRRGPQSGGCVRG